MSRRLVGRWPYFLFAIACAAQSVYAQQDPLAPASDRLKTHVEIIKNIEPQAEGPIRSILQSARQDWSNTSYQGKMGAKRHPWLNQPTGVNPQWSQDYYDDSQRVVAQDVPVTWSCFQPQLVAKGSCTIPPAPETDIQDDMIAPLSMDLALECRRSCPCNDPLIPTPFPDPWIGDVPAGSLINGYEVSQFWIPEYEGERNDWGVMAYNPANEPGGSVWLRTSLLGAKQQAESRTKQELASTYPLTGNAELGQRQDPNIGHNLWGGYATPDLQDRASVHVYRSLYMKTNTPMVRKSPPSPFGWIPNPTTILDSFFEKPFTPTMKHVLSMWTEHGFYETLTVIPQLSEQAGQLGAMALPALYGQTRPMKEIAKQQSPFWQKQGALAYRISRWPNYFGPIGKVLKISGQSNPILGEITYIGGHELYPLTMSLGGFETPNISSALFMIRRGYEIAGMRELAMNSPFGEAGRMNTYTVKGMMGMGDPNRLDGGRDQGMEVDKFQLIAPVISQSALPADCMRSQKIPNMVETTEDPWVRMNVPANLEGYVDLHKSSIRAMYWNKRVACSCRIKGILLGSWAMDFPLDQYGPGRGTGDRKYGKIEDHLCEYAIGTIPSGWAAEDRPPCMARPGPDWYYGTDDRV